ncbi:membrane-spanning 4-domains subfamily A member 4D isoform X2 [Danio aesculapii]|uniref:membrane-spanning 4-domains subfamily A member 4D isoform X2 n=1 Tax=Danio aesculapii TaxID=1142201 RepID=UPI0024C07513|nr:membrane-spanning 4-domains subfamily A member 4D isoform X2 [Danio aesculapii]
MGEDGASASASEPISTVTGGNKPVHRFLRGQPKSIGVVMTMMGVALFMFGIPMTVQTDMMTSADTFSPFWLGILFCICGILYILSERNPSKKMITASLALSIISTIGVVSACMDFIKSMVTIERYDDYHTHNNMTEADYLYLTQHYSAIVAMECVFLCHSLIGGALLIIMTCFARAALRSSNTQAVVVMRNLPSAE